MARTGGVFQVTRGLLDELALTGSSTPHWRNLASQASSWGCQSADSSLLQSSSSTISLSLPSIKSSATSHGCGTGPEEGSPEGGHSLPLRGWNKATRAPLGVPGGILRATPGLKVVIPSTPFDAKGLLASALKEPDPIVFMEPKSCHSPKMEVPEVEYLVPIGKAKIVREGTDVTLVSYGSMMVPTLEAAEALQSERSVSGDVVDLRTVSPIDFSTVLGSVQKTGRLVVVHEAPRNVGIGAELAATVAEKALDYLKAPIKRVTGFDIPIPLARLEDNYIPSKERVMKAALETVSY